MAGEEEDSKSMVSQGSLVWIGRQGEPRDGPRDWGSYAPRWVM